MFWLINRRSTEHGTVGRLKAFHLFQGLGTISTVSTVTKSKDLRPVFDVASSTDCLLDCRICLDAGGWLPTWSGRLGFGQGVSFLSRAWAAKIKNGMTWNGIGWTVVVTACWVATQSSNALLSVSRNPTDSIIMYNYSMHRFRLVYI